MRRIFVIFVAMIGWVVPAWATEIPVLAYHDIVEKKGADPFEVTANDFARHMQYLKDEGYTPMSLSLIDRVRAGEALLPAKPVLLTFDDGLQSFVTNAWPVLRQHGFPSVLSIVTAWVDGRAVPEAYRGRLLDWGALRTLADSPLVEIVSHSDDLHHGIRSNPQGNEAPASVTRAYDAQSGRYETEEAFRARISADLSRSRSRMVTMLGKAPMAVAWPYGAYDAITVEEARRLGMVYHLTLDEDPTSLDMLPRLNRLTFMRYQNLRDLDDMLTFRKARRVQLRFIELRLDPFAGRSAAEQERQLSALLARLQLLGVNAVIVDPFTRDRRAAFFPNPAIPVAANVLNRVVHQIKTRNERIEYVFVRIPEDFPAKDRVGMYTELARLNRFQGVVFTGSAEHGNLKEAEAIFRRYYPGTKIGYASPKAAVAEGDFSFVELDVGMDPQALERSVSTARATSRRTLFLLHRPQGSSDEQLFMAMHALRAAGAEHYGYTNDDLGADRPALRRVAREIMTHTVVETRR